MNQITYPLVGFFLVTVFIGLLLLGKAARGSVLALGAAIAWLCVQSAIALSGFYLASQTIPPHLIVAILPPLLVIAGLFGTSAGRGMLDRMVLKWCVLLHSIRILVELNLYWLFLQKQVPRLMTFEGGNVDIVIGVSAPIIWWLFSEGRIGKRGLLVWNSLALISVLNSLVRAMLSAPFRFQHFAFDQPTVAILGFPCVLLPAFLVPVVLLCHLVVYRKLCGHEGEAS